MFTSIIHFNALESEALAKAKPEETQVKNAAESDEIAVTDKVTS